MRIPNRLGSITSFDHQLTGVSNTAQLNCQQNTTSFKKWMEAVLKKRDSDRPIVLDKPRRPARPAICVYSEGRSGRRWLPSCFISANVDFGTRTESANMPVLDKMQEPYSGQMFEYICIYRISIYSFICLFIHLFIFLCLFLDQYIYIYTVIFISYSYAYS